MLAGTQTQTKRFGTCKKCQYRYFERSTAFLQLMPSVKMGLFGLCTHFTQSIHYLVFTRPSADWVAIMVGQGDIYIYIAFTQSLTLHCPIFHVYQCGLCRLAQVLPCPQLIFPSKTWFFWGIYLNFQWQKSLKNQYLSPTF